MSHEASSCTRAWQRCAPVGLLGVHRISKRLRGVSAAASCSGRSRKLSSGVVSSTTGTPPASFTISGYDTLVDGGVGGRGQAGRVLKGAGGGGETAATPATWRLLASPEGCRDDDLITRGHGCQHRLPDGLLCAVGHHHLGRLVVEAVLIWGGAGRRKRCAASGRAGCSQGLPLLPQHAASRCQCRCHMRAARARRAQPAQLTLELFDDGGAQRGRPRVGRVAREAAAQCLDAGLHNLSGRVKVRLARRQADNLGRRVDAAAGCEHVPC